MSIGFTAFVHDVPDARQRAVPRWAWRGTGTAIVVALAAHTEWAGALGAALAFTVAEVVFDAAERQRE